jgi:selenide,water dikinase
LFAADMRAKANGDHVTRAFESMQRSLAPCIPVIRKYGASAGTDVTGFGLGGHLLEMLNASDVDAELDLGAIPVLPGVAGLVAEGHESTLRPSNEESVGNAVPLSAHPSFPLLFDPQTAGGLLLGLPADQAAACLAELRDGAAPDARIVGRVTPRQGSVGVVSFTDTA